ncbi:hypothetical protein ACIRVN_07095 [Streptomyces albogriseolus]|uniref:hypothetical protein n=1 Tax=Streptomyces albogriseolus TaxID=1887 RepID=UPI00380CC0C0
MILEEDYPRGFQKVGENPERIVSVSLVQEALTLGAIRMHASITGEWESDILEDVWSHVTDIKIRNE